MSDAVTKPVTKKTKTPTKAPKVASHPTYNAMIVNAIEALKDRKGSSRQAIHKYVVANYKLEAKSATTHLRQALKRSVASGKLVQVKGSYKLGKTEEKPKKKVVKKPVAAKSPKKAAAKKPAAKTVKKSASATKMTKVATKKSTTPTKKPKAVSKKSPAKSKAAKKTLVKKPVAKKSARKTAAKK